jgi:malate dehydrogenase (oxaloacetate-decarboxylating)
MREEALKLHKDNRGKLAVASKVPLQNAKDLSLAYSPGVAEPCLEIHKDVNTVYDYTAKGNFVAIVSDGTAVLGLGNIGAEAAMPVMEGKAVLFKSFAGVDAFPICLGTNDIEEIVRTVKLLEPTFGGINLEDIAAPACFEIESRLKKEMNIPVFHDDQHGTAIVTAAATVNALKVAGKELSQIRLAVNGAGAAAMAVTKLLLGMGAKDVIICDSSGPIYKGRKERMNPYKEQIAETTNPRGIKGSLAEAVKGCDVFIGLSVGNVLTAEMVRSMAPNPVIFAMANPVPEIDPALAKEAGALVVGTGRSDYPNQINNVLAFPGVFRGALDTRAKEINEDMKIAAVLGIAGLISPSELSADYIIPRPFDPRVAPAVAAAVAKAAMDSGAARIAVDPEAIAAKTRTLASI